MGREERERLQSFWRYTQFNRRTVLITLSNEKSIIIRKTLKIWRACIMASHSHVVVFLLFCAASVSTTSSCEQDFLQGSSKAYIPTWFSSYPTSFQFPYHLSAFKKRTHIKTMIKWKIMWNYVQVLHSLLMKSLCRYYNHLITLQRYKSSNCCSRVTNIRIIERSGRVIWCESYHRCKMK